MEKRRRLTLMSLPSKRTSCRVPYLNAEPNNTPLFHGVWLGKIHGVPDVHSVYEQSGPQCFLRLIRHQAGQETGISKLAALDTSLSAPLFFFTL